MNAYYNYYDISNKDLLEECGKEESVAVIVAAAIYCFKRRQ